MNMKNITEALPCRSLWQGWEDKEITGGYTSDLLSDVMAHAEEGQVLITIQAHRNTVAVAVLKDLSALLIANDRAVPEDMIEAARDEEIPIFVTTDDQYTAGWKLQQALVSNN